MEISLNSGPSMNERFDIILQKSSFRIYSHFGEVLEPTLKLDTCNSLVVLLLYRNKVTISDTIFIRLYFLPLTYRLTEP